MMKLKKHAIPKGLMDLYTKEECGTTSHEFDSNIQGVIFCRRCGKVLR